MKNGKIQKYNGISTLNLFFFLLNSKEFRKICISQIKSTYILVSKKRKIITAKSGIFSDIILIQI